MDKVKQPLDTSEGQVYWAAKFDFVAQGIPSVIK